MSKGFFPKSNRTSNVFNQANPLSNKNINDNYYAQSSSRNSKTSRQFNHGIFTNQLNKKDLRKKDMEIPLEIQQIIPDYHTSKARTSTKEYNYFRQSRDEFYLPQQSEMATILRQEIKQMRQQIYYKMKQDIEIQQIKIDQTLTQIVNQSNKIFNKHEEQLFNARTTTVKIKQQIIKLSNNLDNFSKQSEQKIEYLSNKIMATKEKDKEQVYEVQLKNSFQGLSSSICGNSRNQGNSTSNSKLINQFIFQLDSLKKEMNQNKLQLENFNIKLASKQQNNTQSNSSQIKSELAISRQEINTIVQRIMKEEKKSWRIEQTFELQQSKFHQILQIQEANIKDINREMQNIFNNTMNPKFKKIEASLVELYTRIDPQMMQNQIQQRVNFSIEQKMKDNKIIKVRNCNRSQSNRLNSISGLNEDKISYKQTYLIDQQNYLLDSQGNYLVEEVNNLKKRIKIQNNLIYLLQLKGLEIMNCS